MAFIRGFGERPLEFSAVEGLGREASKQENLGYKEIGLQPPTSNLMTSFVIENYLLVQARGKSS